MSKGKFIGAFLFGFGVGAATYKWWPVIREKLEPAGKSLLRASLDTFDKTKDTFWEKSEKIADVIAEIKNDEEVGVKTKSKTTNRKPLDV